MESAAVTGTTPRTQMVPNVGSRCVQPTQYYDARCTMHNAHCAMRLLSLASLQAQKLRHVGLLGRGRLLAVSHGLLPDPFTPETNCVPAKWANAPGEGKSQKKNGQSFADHNQDDNSSHVDYPTPRNMFMMNEVSVTVDCLPRSFLKSKTVLIRRLATRRDNSTMPRRMSILTFMSSPV